MLCFGDDLQMNLCVAQEALENQVRAVQPPSEV
jgi:hypothetical protein